MNWIVFHHLIFAGQITEQNNSDTGKLKKGKSISLSLARIINQKCPMNTEV